MDGEGVLERIILEGEVLVKRFDCVEGVEDNDEGAGS